MLFAALKAKTIEVETTKNEESAVEESSPYSSANLGRA